jgi:hypothetical protein
MVWRLIAVAYAAVLAFLVVASRSIDGPASMLATLAVLALTLPWSAPIFAVFSWTIGHNGAGYFWQPFAIAGLLNAYFIATTGRFLDAVAEERPGADTLAIAAWRAAARETRRRLAQAEQRPDRSR